MTDRLQPRDGLSGAWDRFVGPGMTSGETALVLGSSAAGAAAVALHLAALGAGWPLVLLGALIAADVIGGAVCNMTETTKRWYHRPGTGATDHMGFIALHLVHVAAVAWAFRGPGFDIVFAATVSGWLLLSAVLVLRAPRRLRSPLATLLYVAALAASLHALGPTPGLEWFVPLLFVKLLIGHAVPPVGVPDG